MTTRHYVNRRQPDFGLFFSDPTEHETVNAACTEWVIGGHGVELYAPKLPSFAGNIRRIVDGHTELY